jgi:hypothetical protein
VLTCARAPAFFDANTIHVCMEYMDLGSLEAVYRRAKKLPEAVVAKVAHEVRWRRHRLSRLVASRVCMYSSICVCVCVCVRA